MAKPNALAICLLSFTLCFAVCYGDWCTVRHGGASEEQMKKIIANVCSQFDCSPIKPGGSCFEPNRLDLHASYAMNLDYKKTRFCNQDVSQLTAADPSYRSCHYP